MKIQTIIRLVLLFTAIGTLATAGGLAPISTALTTLKDALLGLAVVIVTLAFIYVGFMMIFKGAGWEDVSRIFIGSILIAGASALATLLFP